MMRAAILIQTGFLASTSSGGMVDICAAIGAGYPDRNDIWLGLRPHDFPLAHDIESILKSNPEKFIHIGHSYGDGNGLVHCAALLAARGKRIDLAVMIDPVVSTGLVIGRIGAALAPEGPFPVPANVDAVVLTRTKNHRPFMPVGRDVEHPNVLQRVIFQADLQTSETDACVYIQDPSVIHTNIDGNEEVRALACSAVMNAIGVAV